MEEKKLKYLVFMLLV